MKRLEANFEVPERQKNMHGVRVHFSFWDVSARIAADMCHSGGNFRYL
jgi:hypothetical protein